MSSELLPPPAETPENPAPVAEPSTESVAKPTGKVVVTVDGEGYTQDDIYSMFDPKRLTWKNTDKVVFWWMVAMHAGAIAAPFFFSWTGLIICVTLHWLTCSIGICLGYHRYLSHRSMKLKKPAEFFTLMCGAISGEGSPLMWASNHRLHHQRSDQKGDPHSPTDGPWWSHLMWFLIDLRPQQREAVYRRYAPEQIDRPIIQFFERTYSWFLFGVGAILLTAGYLIDGWWFALSLATWGLCLRMVFAYHSTWFVNSATHLWGYRNYETRDHSRNLWWVAILSYGEGWHNNHHAHPSVAPAGHRWWEVDMTWWAIKFLKAIGQATDIKDRIPARNSTPEMSR